MADKTKKDPTIGAPKVSDAAHSASEMKYEDNPDKPDPATIAQVQIVPENWPGQ